MPMRALFTKSPSLPTSDDHTTTPAATTATAPSPIPDSPAKIARTLSKRASTPQLYSSTTPAVTISSPGELFPRRVKSKSSLRSTGSSSQHDDEDEDNGSLDKSLVRPSFLRRLSPGLAARVKLLDGNTSKTTAALNRDQGNVGRIPEEQIKELDSLHCRNNNSSFKAGRKGKSWTGIPLGQGNREEGHSYRLEVPGLLGLEEEEEREQPTEVEPESAEPLVTLSPEQIVATIPQDPTPSAAHEKIISGKDEVGGYSAPDMSNIESTLALLRPDSDQDAQTERPPSRGQTDFEKYIQSSAENDGKNPSPPRNNVPSRSSSISSLHRADSVFSFSRSSFSNQLSQLTSIALPQPSSLAASISGISNAPAAIKALIKSAEQIQVWIRKASNVLTGLYAEDDVEWAAAGGRDGLDGVDRAITRFESVVNVYIKSIEEVQLRSDISDVDPDGLKKLVSHMESILNNWAHVKSKLKQVKEQVELAMEWEELWNNVLGDVGVEVDDLSRLIFEMEEKRHQVMGEELMVVDSGNGVDINALETIVEETPANGDMYSNKRFSIGPVLSSASTVDTPVIQAQQTDNNLSDLIGLFARMQPLRASLDFLPMRLSMFQSRAEDIFPSACQEIEDRQNGLENSYKRLQNDAEALRKELGEDRWVRVFRNAASQAQKMFESVERGIVKVQESIETGTHLHNPAMLAKRIENYEAKKLHYVPAIERVIAIIQKGIKDRLTVNGEILRLLSDMKSRQDALNASIKVMNSSLEDISAFTAQHMRDSASSSITMDSPVAASIETPGSSPASSVAMGASRKTPPAGTSSRRGSSVGSTTRTTMSKVKRYSGIPQMSSTLTGKKCSLPKPSVSTSSPDKNKTSTPSSSKSSLTPASAARTPRPSPSPADNRPRWNGSTNTNTLDTGHNFKSNYNTTPSPYSRTLSPSLPSVPRRPMSTVGWRSSYSRETSRSPAPPTARTTSRISGRLPSRGPARGVSPTPTRSILDPPPYSKRRQPPPPPPEPEMPNIPRMRQSYNGISPFSRSMGSAVRDPETSNLPRTTARPGTSLEHSSRRISLLPTPKARSGGRDVSAGSHGKQDTRPPWR